ncbi:hypothetical protein Pint_24781 [Pistacia integerrima]|uniref:Uncharacterized protein n=1 Tax=Pistacia integerrima TaxID=434235 RepID=A0ACC0YDF8_9ROSI|nr:hypothetical protein Pint_24781 [Pistacia integerrima]
MKNPCLSLALWGFLTIIFLFSKSSQQAVAPATLPTPNPRLYLAFFALKAWKRAITSDPNNFTTDWFGPHVCNYTGVYCAPAPDDNLTVTVAGIDLNHGNISGYLPDELGLLTDLAVFHINSNRFCGSVPETFKKLKLLYELDISNNNFSGQFPSVVLSLPSLKFLDIRYNQFSGVIPSAVFDLTLDALFINNNNFQSSLPQNLGNSNVSVLVLANNNFNGCIPSSLTKMAGTLHEIILINMSLTGCLQQDLGSFKEVTVFDVSFNNLVGSLPESIGEMKKLKQLNVAHNKLSGYIPESICLLPQLENFTYSYNYFYGASPACFKLQDKDDQKNCIIDRPNQRTIEECKSFYSFPIDCAATGCSASPPPPPLPSRPTKSPKHHPRHP